MRVVDTAIPAVRLIYPDKYGDARGFFSETYNKRSLAEAAIDIEFVQDNHSHSADRGTIRGLHFQVPPYAQHKLIRVVRGAILDVAVDIRKNSPTYGQHVSAVISAEDWNQILVPIGFAHGFCTLERDTEVVYKASNFYSPADDRGILWNDVDLSIEWPVADTEAVLSDKDRNQPRLSDVADILPF